MILSADDVAPAVLGYSDSESFDTDDMPDNLRYWLDEYARQIAFAASKGMAAEPKAVKQRADVAPKITTLWDQLEPYNDQTPYHNGKQCPTGCVATALAQIMNYHKWPVKPTGKKTFTSYYVGQLSIDFDQITFEWDKMLDRYYMTSPDENINAVATLMTAAGYASEMTYHQNSSGAAGNTAAAGLFTHFGYSKGMSLENRDWYGIEEWENLVYAELTENGPVYYEGTGSGGGHAFVCDGYESETGKFHFNWGWTGKGNGYYRLSALDPDYQGTGGNSLGYNYTQDIIRNLKKATPGVEDKPVLTVGPRMGVITPFESAKLGDPITLKGYDTEDGFKNYSLVTIESIIFGARIHNDATGDEILVESMTEPYDMGSYYKVNIIRFQLPEKLDEGSYTITPIWRSGDKDSWHDMRMMATTRNYVPMEVKGNTAFFGFGEAEGRIEIILTDGPDYYTTKSEFTLKGTLESVGTKDFSGLLCAVFFYFDSKGQPQVADQGEVVRYDVAAGAKEEFVYTSKPQRGAMVDSNDRYFVGIGNANTGEIVSPYYPINVGNRYGDLNMGCNNFKIAKSNALDPEFVNISVDMAIEAGEYHGPLAVGFSLKRTPFEPERYIVSDDVDLIAGDKKTISFSGMIDNVELGTLYYAHLMYKDSEDNWVSLTKIPVQVLVARSFSGVEDVVVDSADATYYDIYGRKIAEPVRGNIYIRRTSDGHATKLSY